MRNKIIYMFFAVAVLFGAALAGAEEYTPQHWSTELQGGFWMPTNGTMKEFFRPCCHLTGMFHQHFLYKSKLGAGVGIGFLSENGTAIGAVSGAPSQDRFNLFLLPMEATVVFRADFVENQVVAPYAKFGFDYVFFRQSLRGRVTKGMKYGLHTAAGIQMLLDKIDSGAQETLERDWGINDLYFTLEARYNWIDDFGGSGLDLSSMVYSFGLLFEY